VEKTERARSRHLNYISGDSAERKGRLRRSNSPGRFLLSTHPQSMEGAEANPVRTERRIRGRGGVITFEKTAESKDAWETRQGSRGNAFLEFSGVKPEKLLLARM